MARAREDGGGRDERARLSEGSAGAEARGGMRAGRGTASASAPAGPSAAAPVARRHISRSVASVVVVVVVVVAPKAPVSATESRTSPLRISAKASCGSVSAVSGAQASRGVDRRPPPTRAAERRLPEAAGATGGGAAARAAARLCALGEGAQLLRGRELDLRRAAAEGEEFLRVERREEGDLGEPRRVGARERLA